MKKMLIAGLLVTSFASAAFANHDEVVLWKNVVGVITSPGVDAPVAGIHAGATAWSVRNGRAVVDLTNGETFFEVEGLSINSSNSSGTPGPITEVIGTLICNPGTTQTVLDTVPVALNAQGDARFTGRLAGVPASCGNPLFLVRIAAPAGAAGRWIATGTERFIDDDRR
jgi:hypothetical protein